MNISAYRTIEAWINATLKESSDEFSYRYSGTHFADYPGEQYGIVLQTGRYASNLDESNWDTITDHMQARYPREVEYTSNALWLKLIRKDGKPTQAALHMYDILYNLENRYCLFDEEDYTAREYKQQLESIEDTLRGHTRWGLPENYLGLVYEWLFENSQESLISEDKAYCDDLAVFSAALDLGFIDMTYDDPEDSDWCNVPEYVMRSFDRWVESAFNRNRF